jgi:hypothetical protein
MKRVTSTALSHMQQSLRLVYLVQKIRINKFSYFCLPKLQSVNRDYMRQTIDNDVMLKILTNTFFNCLLLA